MDQRADRLGVLRCRHQRLLSNRGMVLIIIGVKHARMTMHDVVWPLEGEVMGGLPSR